MQPAVWIRSILQNLTTLQIIRENFRHTSSDVGQGDSALNIFSNKTILIDAGDVDQGDRVVSYLKKLGVTRVDLLGTPHSHSDHIGGMLFF